MSVAAAFAKARNPSVRIRPLGTLRVCGCSGREQRAHTMHVSSHRLKSSSCADQGERAAKRQGRGRPFVAIFIGALPGSATRRPASPRPMKTVWRQGKNAYVNSKSRAPACSSSRIRNGTAVRAGFITRARSYENASLRRYGRATRSVTLAAELPRPTISEKSLSARVGDPACTHACFHSLDHPVLPCVRHTGRRRPRALARLTRGMPPSAVRVGISSVVAAARTPAATDLGPSPHLDRRIGLIAA